MPVAADGTGTAGKGRFIFIGLSRPQAEPDLPQVRVDAVAVGDVFQAGQRRRAVGILDRHAASFRNGQMGYRVHQGGFSGEGVKLLGEAEAVPVDGIDQFLPELRDDPAVSIALQGKNRPLVRQPFRLPAPVVFRRVAEGRIAGRNARKREGRPEFRRVQQVLPDEAVRHSPGYAAPVHAAERVVAQDVHPVSAAVPVEQGSALSVPQAAAKGVRNEPGFFLPAFSGGIPLDPADFRKGAAG